MAARTIADAGPMTRTKRRGSRATLLLITRLLTTTDRSPMGCEPAGPLSYGWAHRHTQRQICSTRTPRGAIAGAALVRAHRRRTSRRPWGGGILPERRAV